MTAAPKDLELNIPARDPDYVAEKKINYLNWRNWLAAIIASILIFNAMNYSFTSTTERMKMRDKLIKYLNFDKIHNN